MKNSIPHVLKACRNSIRGLHTAILFEYAFRIEIFIGVFVVPLALYIAQSNVDRILLIGSWLLILILELVNSAIETIVDRISLETHVLSGRAKDYGSTAVFLACINALIIWFLVIIRLLPL